jgi:cell division protease FtsH
MQDVDSCLTPGSGVAARCMAKKRDGSKRPSDRKSATGGNLVWSLIAAGAVSLFALSLIGSTPDLDISYSDLERLVRAAGAEGGQRWVTIAGSRTGLDPRQDKPVGYGDLHDLVIGSFQVTGKVREVPATSSSTLQPPSSAEPTSATESADGPSALDHAAADEAAEHDDATNASGRRLLVERALPGGVRRFRTAKLPSDNSEADLVALLKEQGVAFRYEDPPSAWRNWLPMLLLTALFGGLLFVMMRRIGGAGSPMAFGRSRGKMYAQEDLGITFDDVAGIDEAVEELREVVEFLRSPEKYQVLGGHIPKGVLLVGPPGTGKTLLAKAIAGEAGVPFFGLSGSDFVEMFVGVGAARVRDMFQQAAAKAPCIIFIDELDALGKTRGTSVVGGHDEREQTLNALLVEMDGFGSNSGVIVLAATNRPETLDPALLRPGRFDRHVLVDRPDVRGRESILRVHIANVKLDPHVDVAQIARITSGFVGADLANLVNEAALLAARNGKSAVGMVEFNEGVERVTAGLEKKKRVIHEDEKKRVAYHEAAHALVAWSLPNTDPVHKVSIIPRGLAALGYTMQRPEDDRYLLTQSELESRVQVLLAGTIAEEMVYADVSTGAQNDLERASEIARAMVMDYGMSRLGRVAYRENPRSPFLAGAGADLPTARSHSEQTAREIDEEVRRIIDEAMAKVRRILEGRRTALEAVTRRLIECEVIDGEELQAIVEVAIGTPQLVPGTDTERRLPRTPPASDAEPAAGTAEN